MLLAFIGGTAVVFQISINSQLGSFLGHPVQAALVSFTVGTIVLFLYSFTLNLEWPELNTIIQTPWWLWIGGALGAFYVFCTIFLAPKLGGATLIGLVISGQMIVSLILDHYGFLGFAQQPINIWRILGVFLLLIGVILIKIN
jgi:transporter family-2 protein